MDSWEKKGVIIIKTFNMSDILLFSFIRKLTNRNIRHTSGVITWATTVESLWIPFTPHHFPHIYLFFECLNCWLSAAVCMFVKISGRRWGRRSAIAGGQGRVPTWKTEVELRRAGEAKSRRSAQESRGGGQAADGGGEESFRWSQKEHGQYASH